MRFTRHGDAVREPAGLATHGLDDEVAVGGHGVRPEVQELIRHDADGGEEPEREVDTAIVVVDGLGDVDDADAGLGRRQPPLELIEDVRGAKRVVPADRDQRVELELPERLVHPPQGRRALGIVQVREAPDGFSGIGSPGAHEDAALVTKPP